MKPQREIVDYLNDIKDALEKIEEFAAGVDFNYFSEDYKTSFAVIRALEIIGEAAKKIPRSFRTRHPEVPWQKRTGMDEPLVFRLCRQAQRRVARFGPDKGFQHLSGKPTSRRALPGRKTPKGPS